MESKDITYSEEAVIPKLQNLFKQHLRASGMISGIAL